MQLPIAVLTFVVLLVLTARDVIHPSLILQVPLHGLLDAFLKLAVELGCRGLIDAAGLLEVVGTDGLEDAEDAYCIDIGCELWCIERHLHMALCGEVVDFIGSNLANDSENAH